MTPPVRYAQSGDVNIAYQSIGKGPPDLLFCIGSYSHLDVLWDSPAWARTFERLGEMSRFILFDKRGMGLSDRANKIYTLEERIDDIRAVLDAVGSDRAYLMGFSEGGAMASLFAATYPQRVSGLILYGAPVCYSWKPDYVHGQTEEEFEQIWSELRKRNYVDDFSAPRWRHWLGPALRDDPAFLDFWARLRRAMGSPAARYDQAGMNRLIDIRPFLPTIQAPTLVLVREDDPVAPVDVARYTASHIAGARLVVLPGQGHLMFDVFDEWSVAIEEFVTGASRPVATERFLTTLVFADIAGSTDLIARVGDARWRDTLARHYEIVARRLAM